MRVCGSKNLLWTVEVLHAARFMGISAHTVSHHLSDIFDRVGCGNRPELTVRYFHERDKRLYRKKEFSGRLAQLRKAPARPF